MSAEIKKHFDDFISHSHNSHANFVSILKEFGEDRSDVVTILSSAAFHCKVNVHQEAAAVKRQILVNLSEF